MGADNLGDGGAGRSAVVPHADGGAVEIEHGGWRCGGGDLDAAAHAEGTLAAGARTRDRHAAERALWRERLVRLGLDQSGVSVQVLSDGRVVDRFTGEVLGRVVDPALEDVPLPEEPAA